MGKLRRVRGQAGFVFLDLLIAIFIASAAVVSVFSSVSLTARTARSVEGRISAIIAERTAHAKERQVTFINARQE